MNKKIKKDKVNIGSSGVKKIQKNKNKRTENTQKKQRSIKKEERTSPLKKS